MVSEAKDGILPPRERAKPWEQLRDTGLLWLINTSVFHPRGFSIAFVYEEGELKGWRMLGDGTEPWTFGNTEDALFQAVEAFLDAHRPTEVEADAAEETTTTRQLGGGSTHTPNI